MSAVYIPGMEMPKGLGKTITIYPNGTVRVWVNNKGSGELLKQRAVPVPPHGRLIDADELPWIEGRDEQDNQAYLLIKKCVDVLPTIIPASREGER